MDSFFLPLGAGRWRATGHTVGPWDTRFQHGGPPSALLGRAIEQCEPRADLMVARVTVEILGPIPVAELEVSARVLRPGRSVELVEAVLLSGDREVATARGWRVLRAPGPHIASRLPTPPGLPSTTPALPDESWSGGYLRAVEWRWARGEFVEPGPAAVWTRALHPLVPGEEMSPLQRVLLVADSGNGASSELDPRESLFINPELTVHLFREPRGEWVCLDAQTAIASGGVGLATSVLSDAHGAVGVGAQSLLVAPR